MLSDIQKMFKPQHIIVLLGVIVLVYALYSYSEQKGMIPEYNTNYKSGGSASSGAGSAVQPSNGENNETFAAVSGMSGPAAPSSAAKQPVANPSDLLPNPSLLPRDPNSQWAQLNPVGSGDLQNQTGLISATFLAGIDTVGNTMKNPNLQVRSEPPNPQLNVGPWNNSTFAPDLARTPLEIGVGSQ